MTTDERHRATQAWHRAQPGWPERDVWCLAMVRDPRIGPQALAVGLLIASVDHRRFWPKFVLSTRSIGNRLAVSESTVETVIGAYVALSYMSPTGELEGTRRIMRAVLPPDRVAVSADQDTSD